MLFRSGKAITGKIDSLHPTPEPSQAESQSHHKYTAVTNSLSNSKSDTQSHTHSSHRTGQVGILSLFCMVLVMIIQGVFLGLASHYSILHLNYSVGRNYTVSQMAKRSKSRRVRFRSLTTSVSKRLSNSL